MDIGGQVGYNTSARGVDAELSLAKRLGIARVIVAGRTLADPFDQGHVRFAAAGGATIRFGQYMALAGDFTSLMDRSDGERIAWSAGLHFAIPLTPHTFSLQATNIAVTTLQGASRGQQTVRYGFEFTIPLTLRRYFGKRAGPLTTDTAAFVSAALVDSAAPGQNLAEAVVPVAPVMIPDPEARPSPALPTDTPVSKKGDPSIRDTTRQIGAPSPAPAKAARAKPAQKVRRTVIRNMSYVQQRLEVTVGTTIEWTNNDPLEHSVTAANKSFSSGLISPGKSYRHTFTKAGTYDFYCMPHPFMKGVIVVRGQ